MKILKSKLKRIIREELSLIMHEGGPLEEGWKDWAVAGALGLSSFAGPQAQAAAPVERPAATQAEVSSNMNKFLEAFPMAAREKTKQLFSNLTQQQTRQIKQELRNLYSSTSQRQAFVELIKSVPGFESESDEDILRNHEIYKRAVEKTLDSVVVVAFHDAIDDVLEGGSGIDLERVRAFYDTDDGKIYINPFSYAERRFDLGNFRQDLKEEYIHAVQSHIQRELGMPVANLLIAAAQKADVILAPEATNISAEAYRYLTTPVEFHAKMLELKSRLLQQGVDMEEAIQTLINSDNPPEILKVLDPTKIEKIVDIFDMVAKAPTSQKTSQIA